MYLFVLCITKLIVLIFFNILQVQLKRRKYKLYSPTKLTDAHLEHVVRSTKPTYYRGKLIPNFPVYSGQYHFVKYYTNTPAEERRSRFKLPPRTVIKEGVVGNEWGILEEHGHCHMYLKFHKKVYIYDLQRYIRRRCRFLGSIEPGRSAEKTDKILQQRGLPSASIHCRQGNVA